jgi:hypothetical protein
MMHNNAKRRIIFKAVSSVGLSLALMGCQQTHFPTTQVVVQVSPNQTAVAEVAAPEPASSPTTQETPAAPNPAVRASEGAGHDVAQASREAGHDVARASVAVGHDVAEASRETYFATANEVREVPSSTNDLVLHSTVRIKNSKPESLSAPEIDIDEAMQIRDWDQVAATYQSGATIAGPTGFRYQPKPGQPLWHYDFVDMPLFLVNTGLIPYAFFKIPPWKPVEWKAATVEPTYTAVPPLPPE